MKVKIANLDSLTKKTYLEYQKLFPVLKREKTKQYGMLIFTFATMTFFGIFAINPTLKTIAELQRKLKDAQLVENELSKKITNLSILQNKYTTLLPDLESITAALPESHRAPRFVGQLQAIVKQSGVALSVLSTHNMTINAIPPIDSGSFTFDVQVSGTFEQIDSFLKNLTQFERIVVIDTLSITKQSVLEKKVTINVSGAAHYKQ